MTDRPRWTVVITDTWTGRLTVYGPWHDVGKARRHAAQLKEKGYDVSVARLGRWQGIDKFH